jgi:uncharacterized protein (TIGR03083 family)
VGVARPEQARREDDHGIDETAFGPPLDARPHLAADRAAFLQLLHALTPDDWERSTAAAPWAVRDVVAHVLGDDLGRLARGRDGHVVGGPEADEPFAAFIHRLNAEWVRATARLSPRLLLDLLEHTSPQVLDHWRSLDLDALDGPVTWAGPAPAPVWLDCARDFTEYWVHQQQVRDATGRPDDGGPAVVHAVLDTFLRAVPHTLSGVERPDGTTLTVAVPGPAGGRWTWRSAGRRWWAATPADAPTTVTVAAEPLWRLCVRMLEPADVGAEVSGDPELGAAVLRIVSIIR